MHMCIDALAHKNKIMKCAKISRKALKKKKQVNKTNTKNCEKKPDI